MVTDVTVLLHADIDLCISKTINAVAERKTFNDLINDDKPVLVDFYADWCGPCKMMAPVLEAFSNEMTGKVKVIKVDVDKNPTAAMNYQIQGVPTLILFKKGQVIWRQSGVVPAHQLRSVVSSHI
ncbi:MAG: thioredoxin [Cyclobacteriaceae bacterium]